MKALIQRVKSASVTVEGAVIGSIDRGLLVLLGVAEGDQESDVRLLAEKIVGLRIFNNSDGKFDLSLSDGEGDILLVSQFTLLGDTSKGRRPNFQKAAKPDEARRLYELFRNELRSHGFQCPTGAFGAHMEISLINDGPVTLMLDSQRTNT